MRKLIIISLTLLYFFSSHTSINAEPSYTPPPYAGHKFIWIKNNREGFTEEQMQKIATTYNLVVIGNLHANGNKDIEHADVQRLKQINPSLPVYLYFPANLRHEGNKYGDVTFQDTWYLRTLSGEYYIDEDEVLRTIDLTIPAYRTWAINFIRQFLNAAPYDGLAMDNAGPIPVNSTSLDKLGQTKLEAVNQARTNYLIKLTNIANRRNLPLIHNSIGYNSPDSRANIQYTNGGLDELLCSRKTGLRPIEEQLANIEFQFDAGRDHKILLLRTPLNVPLGTLSVPQYDRYCYGLFLMGHVPGYTFFDLSNGYDLHSEPGLLDINEQQINLPFGNPQGKYQNNQNLLSRKFQNGYVVVNLNETNKQWAAPEKLEVWNGGVKGRTITANSSVNIPARDTLYLLKPGSNSPSPSPSSNVSGDFTGDGHVTLADYNLLVSGYGTTYNLSHYNQLTANFGR